MKTSFSAFALLALAMTPALAADQPSWGAGADDAAFAAMLNTGFREKGIAALSRLKQDNAQAFCSDPARANAAASANQRAAIEKENAAYVKAPSNGKWLGDWKEGEKIAQSGRGLTSSDKAGEANGGNCYNCHQLSKAEISYGTIGPSLYNYGKNQGADEATLRAAWARIYDAKSINACSNMPRFGHMGILTEKQMQDVMALLFDPDSPVNK